MERRDLLLGAASLGGLLAVSRAPMVFSGEPLFRRIPISGELIPAIGMGTWQTFNVGTNPSLLDGRCRVLSRLFESGGRMVDSSPMYGTSESVVGHCAERIGHPADYLPATKVWTDSAEQGARQIAESFRLWRVDRFALFQVHNLVGWRSHLPLLRELRQAGRIRYIGVTTSHGRRHKDLLDIMRNEPLDFVQLTYNLADREAEQGLLPVAAERGIAVIANRPFRRGVLIDRLAKHPLPAWAAQIGCRTVAQFLLKFIISHPAVTCAIPATSREDHMVENMGAMLAPLPDDAMRRRMVQWLESA